MVPCAHLRAFEPLDAFPGRERERWSGYVSSGGGLSGTEAVRAEVEVATARMLTGRSSGRGEEALVRRIGARIHVCPLQLELRAAVALAEFRRQVPESLLEAFLPDRAARNRLDRLAMSGQTPHTRDAAWLVPLAWFVAFEPDERRVLDPPEGRGPRVVHLTTAAQAAERLVRAITVVEAGLEDGEEVLLSLAEVATWVDGFDPRSVIELDYGGVAALLEPAALVTDRTCADLWEAIEHLEAGDLLGAAAAYGVARSRWTGLHQRQFAS